ncbi:MAG: DUF4065 domain-containing protein [Clostridia bacterium]|nr:DUF4065 domain-containing protein [Clostridia bacterium]
MNIELIGGKGSEAVRLAWYVKQKYLQYEKNIDKREISPIKLQKTLYFLFAYWGQYILKNKNNSESVEVNYSDYSEYLFEDDIEAWTYGPVVPSVFHGEKNGWIDKNPVEGYLEDDPVKKEFIDYLLPQLFDISDFGLVDLSHQDECWKKYYNQNEEKHNNIIPKDEIISEYCNKTA